MSPLLTAIQHIPLKLTTGLEHQINMQHKTWIKVTLLLASTLTVMAGATVAAALPQIQSHFTGTPHIEILSRLVLTLPALMIVIFAPIAGNLIDRFGRIKLMVITMISYAIGGASGFFIEDIYLLLAGRALLGISVAGIMTTATTLIGDYFVDKERQKFMGKQGAFMALGGMVFITLGGALADINWHYPFLLYLFSILLLPLIFLVLYEPSRAAQPQQKQTIFNQDFPKLRVGLIYFAAFLGMIFFYMVPVQIPFLLKSTQNISNFMVGISVAIATLSAAIAGFNYRKVRKYLTYPIVYTVGFALMATGFFLIYLINDYWVMMGGLAISGFGAGFIMPNASLWLLDLVPEVIRGRIIGLLTTFIFLGQFLSPIAVQPLVDQWSIKVSFGISSGFLILISGMMIIWHVVIFGKRKQHPDELLNQPTS